MPRKRTIGTYVEKHHLPPDFIEDLIGELQAHASTHHSGGSDPLSLPSIAGILAYAKLDLSDSIVNGDINVSAGIDFGKIATFAISALFGHLTDRAYWKSADIGELEVKTANIDNLAVTNAKINDLNAEKIDAGYLNVDRLEADSIESVKLYSGEVMAKLIGASHIRTDTAVITQSAQIQNAIVTNLKIASGTISFEKADSDFGSFAFLQHNRVMVSGEAALGYSGYSSDTSGSGIIEIYKSWFRLYHTVTTTSHAELFGSKLHSVGNKNRVKAKVMLVISEVGTFLKVGLGNHKNDSRYICLGVKQVAGTEQFKIGLYWRNGAGDTEHADELTTANLEDKQIQLEFYWENATTAHWRCKIEGYAWTAWYDTTVSMGTALLEETEMYAYFPSPTQANTVEVWYFQSSEDWT